MAEPTQFELGALLGDIRRDIEMLGNRIDTLEDLIDIFQKSPSLKELMEDDEDEDEDNE